MSKTKLVLREREGRAGDMLLVPLEIVKAAETPETLWEIFKGVRTDGTEKRHDKEHLLVVINWVPQNGIPLSEQVKWLDLARRVNHLKGTDGEELVLYGWEVEMLWKRMSDGAFKMRNFSVPFLEFVVDFCEATGRQFKDLPEVEEEMEA